MIHIVQCSFICASGCISRVQPLTDVSVTKAPETFSNSEDRDVRVPRIKRNTCGHSIVRPFHCLKDENRDKLEDFPAVFRTEYAFSALLTLTE